MQKHFVAIARLNSTGEIVVGTGYSKRSKDDAILLSIGRVKEPHTIVAIDVAEEDCSQTFPAALRELGIPEEELNEAFVGVRDMIREVFKK